MRKGPPDDRQVAEPTRLVLLSKSRWDNPSTSREAAESIGIERISETQQRVLEVFRFIGGEMCDEQLVKLYFDYWPNSAMDQSIKSRRGELVGKEMAFDSGKRTSRSTAISRGLEAGVVTDNGRRI